jgi:hypothetical protein
MDRRADFSRFRLVFHEYDDGGAMVEVYLETQRFGSVVLVFLHLHDARELKYHGLFVDCWRGKRFMSRAAVIDEFARDVLNQLQYVFMPVVCKGLSARRARRSPPTCWYPLGVPEYCWGIRHGWQPYHSTSSPALEDGRWPRVMKTRLLQ